MTIFEQTINTSQVQMELSNIAVFIVIAICFIFTALCTVYFYGRILDYQLSEETSKSKVNIIISIIAGISVFVGGFFLTLFAPYYLPPPIKALSQPVYGESKTHGVKNSSEKSIADTYREDIDKAIKDKLSDYEIPEYSIDNPQKSILGGGYLEKKIAAVHDGKTYTLTPEWSYDRDTSTVKLDVDIEEGYNIQK